MENSTISGKPLVLLFAEPVSQESLRHADLIFSASSEGLIASEGETYENSNDKASDTTVHF